MLIPIAREVLAATWPVYVAAVCVELWILRLQIRSGAPRVFVVPLCVSASLVITLAVSVQLWTTPLSPLGDQLMPVVVRHVWLVPGTAAIPGCGIPIIVCLLLTRGTRHAQR